MEQEIKEILSAILGTSNEQRKNAEQIIEQLYQNSPQKLFEALVLGLSLSDTQQSELAALLIRKKFIEKAQILKTISQEKVLELVGIFQKSYNDPKRSLTFLKRATEFLVLIYAQQSAFAELIKFINALAANNNTKIKQCVLYFIELACEYSFDEDIMKNFASQLSVLFEKYLVDEETIIKVCAIKAVTAFLANIEDKTLIQAVKTEEESGRATIESIIDLMEYHPKFIKPISEDLITIFTDIIDAPSLGDDLKAIAITALATLASVDEVTVRKSETFSKKAIPILLKTLMKVQDVDLKEWNKDLDDEAAISKKDPQSCVQDTLPKFADALGTKFILIQMMPYIAPALKSKDWREQYGGLIAISQVSEGSCKHFANDLDNLLALIFPCLESNHPRVVNTALNCLALLCSEFAPTIQIKHHETIMKYLFKFLQQDEYLKIQCTAAAAITNFASKIDEYEKEHKIMIRYAKDLLLILMKLFEKAIDTNNYILQEDVLNAISIIAVGLDSAFAEYYNSFMPGLQKLLVSIPGENERQSKIRCLTIECIGHLIASIRQSPDLFVNNLNEIFELLIAVQNSPKIAFDDPEQTSIINVFTFISDVLKDKFAPLLDRIFPKLAEALKVEVDVVIQDYTAEKNEKDGKTKNILKKAYDLKLFGKKTFAINSGQLMVKIAACGAIYKISRNMHKAYFPYLTKTLELIIPLLTYRSSKEVKKFSNKTILNLVMCCSKEDQVAEILNTIFPIMLEEIGPYIKIRNDVEVSLVLKIIMKCTEILTAPLLKENVVSGICALLVESIQLCDSIKRQILEDFDGLDEVDDDKEAEMHQEYNYINEMCRRVMVIHGILMKLYKEKVEEFMVSKVAPSYFKLLQKAEPTSEEVCYALCLITDILENGSQQMFVKCTDEVLKTYLKYAEKSDDLDILQTVMFGLGVIAQRMDRNTFAPLKDGVLKLCSEIILHPNARSEERGLLTDNTIGALGKIAFFQYQMNDKLSAEILVQFLQMLPLKDDTEEAQAIHKLLLTQILERNEFLCQKEIEGLLLNALSAIRAEDSEHPENEILDDKGRELMKQILGQV